MYRPICQWIDQQKTQQRFWATKTEGTPHRPFFGLTFTFTKKKRLKIWAQHADKDVHNRIYKEQSYKKDQRIICKKQNVNGSSRVHILLLFF